MKIVEQSADRLLVRHTPWFVGGFMWFMGAAALYATLFGAGEIDEPYERLVIAAIGVCVSAVAWWFAPLVEVLFDKRAGGVLFTEKRILQSRLRRFPLSPETRVAQQAEHDEGARLTRLALRTGREIVPLERGFGSADRNAIEAEINRWLAEAAPSAAPDNPPPPRPPRDGPEASGVPTVRRRR